MENNTQISNVEDIQNLIYTVRGRQVMLDSDVARLFQYETKDLNRNVRNNIEKFPKYYCFQLNEEEYKSLRCKNFTLNKSGRGQHRKYLPYVFTEHGITMLAGLLKSETAINASIKIVDTFIEMRKFLRENAQLFKRLTTIEYKLLEHDSEFEKIYRQMQPIKDLGQKIFFEGQIYDAYSLIIDIIEKANNKIVIIDNYVDKSILDMLTKKQDNVEAVIITSTKNNTLQNIDIQKFNKQYPTLKLGKTDNFHDRFIIIDNMELYHCGASIKDMGKKCFGINKIEDQGYLKEIVNNI